MNQMPAGARPVDGIVSTRSPRPVGDTVQRLSELIRGAGATPFAVIDQNGPAGQPCANLRADFRCSIHDHLRDRGFPGCTTYDCFGAGQQVAQVTFGGRDWRRAPEIAQDMFSAFTVMRQLHELLWYLAEARALPAAGPVHGELDEALDQVGRLTRSEAAALTGLDVGPLRGDVSHLLRRG